MKKFLTIVSILGLASGYAFAGCGKKVNDEGSLTSYDAATKTIEIGGSTLTLKPDTEVKDASGAAVEIADLVGKTVKVVSEHNKVDSVTAEG